MNVYDFDNTIYDGESVVDFYLFLLRYNPRLLMLFPKMVYMLVCYKLCKITEDQLLIEAEKYIKKIFDENDIEKFIPKFWDENAKKIKRFYLDSKREDDVILSASADILISEICKRIGVKNVVASKVDAESGKVIRLCYRSNKIKIFKELFPEAVVDKFYTDSMNDSPMFEIAKQVFIVKGNKIEEFKL